MADNEKELEELKNLVDEVNMHCHNYYVLDNPTISDYEFDVLYDRLVELENKLGVVLDYSPTRRVGAEVSSSISKIEHKEKLYSLGKVNTYEELREWLLAIQKDYPNTVFGVENKFDGLTLNLTYNNGVIKSIATRGNGQIGEDVTAQALTIKSIPLKIKYKGEVCVQGEGVMFHSDLEEYNKTASEPLKNVRNGVAGALRNLDPKETAKRKLNIFLYNISYIEDRELIQSQQDIETFLKENGFKNLPSQYFKSVDDVINRVKEMDEERKTLDYLTDGAVIKVSSILTRNELGETIKFPRWAIAFKYAPEELSTRLIDVVWQVGKTGKITPTAILEPIELAGAMVGRATLNNMGDIERKGILIPSRVFVRRSNEVIPEITGLAELEKDSKIITAPQVCPSCGGEVSQVGALLFCLNSDCREQIINKITHFVSKEAMNIDGVSEKSIIQMYDRLNIKTVADLYYLTEEDILKLDGFKEKKIKNFFDEIEKSKEVNLSNFIFALCISNVGIKTAKELSNHFGSLEKVMEASVDELASMYDVGEIVASCVVDFFANSKNKELVNRLLSAGIKIKEDEKAQNDNFFSGKKVVLTGTLEQFSRTDATKLLESYGAQVLSSVSIKCDYVVAGANAGSKLTKAQELGVQILSEQEFIELTKKGQ